MFGIGPMELVLILVVALLVLGPKRMPELARTLGKGLNEFRRASSDLRQSLAIDEIQNELRDGLTGSGTIHKPMKRPDVEDAPAQAGDDLPPPGPPPGPPGDAATSEAEGPETSDASSESQSDTGDAAPPVDRHPGELPDDLDPHSHHESADTSADDTDASATIAPSAADPGLGSVPVGGRAPEGGVPAGARVDPDSERGRG